MAKAKILGKAIQSISSKLKEKPKPKTKAEQKNKAKKKPQRPAKKQLQKNPVTIKEANQKGRHHHAATVKALTRQQEIVRKEAQAAKMRVAAYKQKFPDRPSVKKLKQLQKQNETVRNKIFNKGGAVKKK